MADNLQERFHMKILKTIVGASLILMLAFPGTSLAVRVGDQAPAFETQTIDGNLASSAQIKNQKPLFLVFWATWCPYCITEIPKLKQVFSSYSSKGMEFLAIDTGVNDSVEKVKDYIKKYDLSYPVVFDEGSKITKSFGILGVPTVVIVDKFGTVRYVSGSVPADLGDHFDRLIASDPDGGQEGDR